MCIVLIKLMIKIKLFKYFFFESMDEYCRKCFKEICVFDVVKFRIFFVVKLIMLNLFKGNVIKLYKEKIMISSLK